MPHALQAQFRAELLRASLAERNMTQEELARRTGARLGTVSRWCRGLAQPRGHELIALSQQLGVPAATWYQQPDTDTEAAA